MTDWRIFLTIAGCYLRETNQWTIGKWSDPASGAPIRKTWCSWTTFSRLADNAGYWTGELPLEAELLEKCTTDGGNWGQPFGYDELAHVIIPPTFTEEGRRAGQYTDWDHTQDIEGLSKRLDAAGIAHTLSVHALDIKLF